MKKFLMICYVACDFTSPKGDIFSVRAKDLGVFVEAPEWVKETLLFKLLLRDGSVKVALDKPSQKKLENDPTEGVGVDGKKIDESAGSPVDVVTEVIEEPKKKTTRKKKDDAE